MKKQQDFLVEIHTEELPPKALLTLATAFHQQVIERLDKENLTYKESQYFATPRRLAVLIKKLDSMQADQSVEKKGPSVKAAYDENGAPTKACIGFAKSLHVDVKKLSVIKSSQGEWVGYQQHVPGQSVKQLLPNIISDALHALPIPKRMRWGASDIEFVRPVYSVIMLYGKEIIDATILGCKTNRKTRGHRFISPAWFSVSSAGDYEKTLQKKGCVIVDFDKRRELIKKEALAFGKKDHRIILDETLLDEVTGLVEWPFALCGQFEQDFLRVPKEALISAMQDHQRYFPVCDAKGKLAAEFVFISNINSKDKRRVIHGNERVLRARLADAAFFFDADQKEKLDNRLTHLKGMVYQAKLGTLFDRAERLSTLSGKLALALGENVEAAMRAGLLAKCDLTTHMVSEFPELQGTMGGYYALSDGEHTEVADAIKEHYMPLGAGAELPPHLLGVTVALADRIDLLVGSFGINQVPTGDKDPYGLRRAAISLIRLIIEKKIKLDLLKILHESATLYRGKLDNANAVTEVMQFVHERMRAWYQDQGITADVFAAVSCLPNTDLLDMNARMYAVQSFKKMPEAENLCAANKRVSNILSKHGSQLTELTIDESYFDHAAEKALAQELHAKKGELNALFKAQEYDQGLMMLAKLKSPIDDFFEHVMVMSDDPKKRDNRILILRELRGLFLQVADIALLQ